MRRESATVVGLTGEITGSLLAALGRSGNVSIARPPAAPDEQGEADGGRPHRTFTWARCAQCARGGWPSQGSLARTLPPRLPFSWTR